MRKIFRNTLGDQVLFKILFQNFDRWQNNFFKL